MKDTRTNRMVMEENSIKHRDDYLLLGIIMIEEEDGYGQRVLGGEQLRLNQQCLATISRYLPASYIYLKTYVQKVEICMVDIANN